MRERRKMAAISADAITSFIQTYDIGHDVGEIQPADQKTN
jgi:hypothetical protein